ncbi:hypothetical protein BD770DRAFT_443439 [Pilaira anomala]|nr:hypothetical protein BD770DRAFT_443439 [Pilaira anomala]
MLGLPTEDEMKLCLAQKKELEEKVVQTEKHLLARKDAFVQCQKKIASLKVDLSKTGTKVEWLYEKLENTEDEKRAILQSNWNNKSFYFVKEEEAEKKNELLRQELVELKLFEAQNTSFV